MFSFKPIQTEDKETITAITYPDNLLNCDYAFANMCSWRFLYDSEYTIDDGLLIIRFFIDEKERKRMVFMFPVGNGDLRQVIDRMEQHSETSGHPLVILGVTPEGKVKLDTLFPGHFTYIKERDFFDYIYLRDDLVNLTGKKFQPKRNHINKFKKLYDYTYAPVTQDIISECKKLEQVWYEANKAEEHDGDLFHERDSMSFALDHFNELGLLGGALIVDDRIIAFTYGSPINNTTFGIHVEKADIRYEGAFSVMSQEFAMHIPPQYVYINREEDLGIPGLRQSKLSYHPCLLLEKNTAIKRR